MSSVEDLLAHRKYDEAIELLEQRLRKDPENVRVRLQFGDALVSKGEKNRVAKILLGLVDQLTADGFGEISLLTGNPRTATVTAATRCELLELDRATLDDISMRHPRVSSVVADFYEQRAGSDLERDARSR